MISVLGTSSQRSLMRPQIYVDNAGSRPSIQKKGLTSPSQLHHTPQIVAKSKEPVRYSLTVVRLRTFLTNMMIKTFFSQVDSYSWKLFILKYIIFLMCGVVVTIYQSKSLILYQVEKVSYLAEDSVTLLSQGYTRSLNNKTSRGIFSMCEVPGSTSIM